MALNFLLKRSGTASKRPVAASMALGEVDINYNSSTGGLFYKDSAGSVVKVGPAEVGSTAPNSSPAGSAGNSVGEFWFDTSNSALKIWNGSSWVETVSTSGFLPLSGGTMTGTLYISNSELQVESTSTFSSLGTATFTGTTELNGSTSFFFTPTWLENIGPASQVTYDNTTSGLVAIEVQAAVDELASGSWLPAATTTTPGIVQLNDTTSSTSTTEALTANQGKELQDQINALSIASNITLAGTIDATTGNLVTVTSEGTAAGFAIGDPLPAAASGNDNYFVIVTTPGTMTPPGGSAQECHQGDWWLSDGTAWVFLDVGFNATAATTTTPGVVQLATDAEVQAGVNTDHAVTPSGLQSKVSDSTSTTSSTTLASSTAVKAAYDLANAAVPDSSFTALGDLIVGTGAGTFGNLVTGANGTVLSANSACPLGLEWVSGGGGGSGTVTSITAGTGLTGGTITTSGTISLDTSCVIEPTALTGKGAILTATAANTPSALPVGANGQVLVACSTATRGICWCSLPTQGPTSLGFGYGRVGSNVDGNIANGFGALALIDSFLPGIGNTAIGRCALYNIGSGSNNTAIGDLAGVNLTGDNNIIIGSGSGFTLTTGSGNFILGNGIDVDNPTGDNQLAIGWATGCCWLTGNSTQAIKPAKGIIDCAGSCGTAGQVLMSNGANAICWGTAGGSSDATPTVAGIVLGCTSTAVNSCRVGLGCNVFASGTTATNSTAIGGAALAALASGTNNTAVGTRAATALTGGNSNTAVGALSLCRSTNSQNNVAVGLCALGNITTASFNIGIGLSAGAGEFLGANNTGCFNVAIGCGALNAITTGGCNVAIGNRAGAGITTGLCNTSVGDNALRQSTTGCYNTVLGAGTAITLSSGCGNIVIGSMTSAGATAPVFTVTNTNDRISLGSTSVTNAYVQVAWTVVSDARDKVVQGDVPHGLEFVNQLEPKAFHFKEDRESDIPHGPLRYGFLAQDILALEGGDGVIIDAEDPEKLRYNGEALVPVLVNAIKELSARNDALEARLAALEAN